MSQRVYTDELGEKIITRIINGEGIKAICRDLGLEFRTVYYWITKNRFGFGDRMEEALQSRCQTLMDEIIEIADDCPPTDIAVKRAALKIKARQYVCERLSMRSKIASRDATQTVEETESGAVLRPDVFLRQWQERNPPKPSETN